MEAERGDSFAGEDKEKLTPGDSPASFGSLLEGDASDIPLGVDRNC